MQLEPGMRVRCVDATAPDGRQHVRLTHGKEYSVLDVRPRGGCVEIVDDAGLRSGWLADRFKPVVRVKARTCPRGSNPVSVLRAMRRQWTGL